MIINWALCSSDVGGDDVDSPLLMGASAVCHNVLRQLRNSNMKLQLAFKKKSAEPDEEGVENIPLKVVTICETNGREVETSCFNKRTEVKKKNSIQNIIEVTSAKESPMSKTHVYEDPAFCKEQTLIDGDSNQEIPV